MLKRKPIICAEGSESLMLFTYKHKFIGYAWNVPILFYTDLSYKQFCKFLDVGYSGEQIEKFELTGKF